MFGQQPDPIDALKQEIKDLRVMNTAILSLVAALPETARVDPALPRAIYDGIAAPSVAGSVPQAMAIIQAAIEHAKNVNRPSEDH